MYSDFCILFHSVFLCPAFQNRRHWTHKLALHLRGSSPWSAHTRMESNSFHWDSIKSHPLMPRLRVKNRKPVSTHLSSAGSAGRRTDSQNDFSQIQHKKPQPIDYLFTHLQVDQNTYDVSSWITKYNLFKNLQVNYSMWMRTGDVKLQNDSKAP